MTLYKWNHITNNLIHPGQTVIVSEAGVASSQQKDKTYTVQPGDSVWLIASIHGISMEELIALNGIKNYTIHPGQILRVKSVSQLNPKDSVVSQPNNSNESVISTIPKVELGDSVTKTPQNEPYNRNSVELIPKVKLDSLITTTPIVNDTFVIQYNEEQIENPLINTRYDEKVIN